MTQAQPVARTVWTPRRTAKRPSWWRRYERQWLPVVTVIAIFAIWEILGQFKLWNPLFFASPSQILGGFISLLNGPFWSDLAVTSTEFALGMLIALGIGTPVGLLLGSVPRLNYAFDPIVTALYSTPILVLTPLLVIWYGLGIGSKVANVAILAIFPFIINMIEGVRTTDPTLLRAARSFGAKGFAVYRDVLFPSITPFFITGLRLAIGKGLIGVIVGEYIAATSGLGYRIRADAEVFNTDRYLAGVLVIVVASVLLMALVRMFEKRLAPWRISPLDAD